MVGLRRQVTRVGPRAVETGIDGEEGAVHDVVTWPDFHATVLHLLGIDHTRLTYDHKGIRRRLTNVHGQAIKPILA